MEILGVNTSGKSSAELTILYDLLPRLEAYHETLHRRPQSAMTPEKAEYLTMATTGDKELADEAYSTMMFSKPLE